MHKKPDGEVFYVGIGVKNRPYSKNYRNKFWHHVVNKHGEPLVEIVCTELSRKDACEWERLFIRFYGRRDLNTGSLVNMTDGGDGHSGTAWNKNRAWTAAQRRKISIRTREGMKNMSKESKEKMEAAGAIGRAKKHTADRVEKVRKKNLGKHRSLKIRAKMRSAQRTRREAERNKNLSL